jgi:uncharacterized membrane protein YfcA
MEHIPKRALHSSPLLNYIISFFIGLLAGVFGGLVGLGGGVIMIPLMVGILKLDQHTAHGTSLFVIVFTGISGAVAYGMHGSVDVIAALLLAAPAVVTARTGAHFAHSLPEWKLKRFFGCFLVFVSILLLSKSYFPSIHAAEAGFLKIMVLLLTGVCTGFLSGMMGVGGGTIMVPVMVLVAGFLQHTAQGSSLLAMIPTGGVGAYTHWHLGNVRKNLLLGLIPGIFIGSYLGGTLAHVFSDTVLRIIFAVVLIWTGIRYIKTKRSVVTAE